MEGIGYILAVILFVTLIVISIIKREKTYGVGLENEIDRILLRIAKEEGGIRFHDLLFISSGNSSQVDNILLTRKALNVIEAKDYSGWIFGSEGNNYWTQVFTHYKAKTSGNNYTKSGVSKYSFYNPIKQNRTELISALLIH